jgi:multidrug transporter EmrE-like cation transporter
MKYYLVLGIAIITNAVANILMKIGMNKVGGLDIDSLNDIIHKFLLNYIVWLGILFFGIALVSYSYVLSHIQLSIAYPIMTSLGFVIVIVTSLLYLDEKLTLIQLFGIFSIIVGVWLVAK